MVVLLLFLVEELFYHIQVTTWLQHCDKYVAIFTREKLSSFVESHGATTPGYQVLISHFSAPFRRLDKYPALLKELERHIDVSSVVTCVVCLSLCLGSGWFVSEMQFG